MSALAKTLGQVSRLRPPDRSVVAVTGFIGPDRVQRQLGRMVVKGNWKWIHFRTSALRATPCREICHREFSSASRIETNEAATEKHTASTEGRQHDRGVMSGPRNSDRAAFLKQQQQQQQPIINRNPIPDFHNAQIAYATKSTAALLRAALAFGLCQVPFLVRHAETLLSIMRAILRNTVTDAVLQATLFGHFCAGTNERTMQPTIHMLQKAGIGSILDYAAEDDGSTSTNRSHIDNKQKPVSKTSRLQDELRRSDVMDEIAQQSIAKARIYDYESEAQCDRHLETFRQCIHAVAALPDQEGYAAVKITALGNPKLLQRMSRAIVEAQNLFAKFDVDGDGTVSPQEFEQAYRIYFKDDCTALKDHMDQLLLTSSSSSATANPLSVDYITWSMMLAPRDLPRITAGCREVGPLALATPTDEEIELMETMFDRGHKLAREAAQTGTRLLIDAEQTRFQPAIDNLVLDLQRAYNATSETDHPIIYNTYQCYLKDVPQRLPTDVERSERFNYHFGAKLVRGAYMESERDLARKLGYPSPIHNTLQDTHNCYNDAVRLMLEHAVKSNNNKAIEIMLATHNQESIEKAIAVMNELGIDRKDSIISFGQLYGMMDHLTFQLGQHGYRAYKYVPYGEIKMVMPYLIRRANENSSIAGGATRELSMIRRELKRRLLGMT